jgi:hypothetical protein
VNWLLVSIRSGGQTKSPPQKSIFPAAQVVLMLLVLTFVVGFPVPGIIQVR